MLTVFQWFKGKRMVTWFVFLKMKGWHKRDNQIWNLAGLEWLDSLFLSYGFLVLFFIVVTVRKGESLNPQGKFHMQTSLLHGALVSIEVQKRNAILPIAQHSVRSA